MDAESLNWKHAAIAAAMLLLAGCSGQNEAEQLAAARGFLQKNDTKAAVIQLKSVLQEHPQSAEARFLLGKSLLAQGDAAGAEIELRRAEELRHPADAVAPVMARVLLAKGEYFKLVSQFGSVELADPAAASELQITLAAAHAAQRQFDEAHKALDQALRLAPQSVPAQLALLRLKTAEGDAQGALQLSGALTEKLPGEYEAWLAHGDLLLQVQRDRDGAAAAYAKALTLRADLPQAHAALIALQLARQDLQAARAQLEAMKKALPKHPQTRLLEAQLAYTGGDYKQARTLVQAVLQAAPENVLALHLAGVTELKLGATPQAENYLAAALKHAPGYVPSRRALAQLYLQTRQPAKALQALKPLLEAESPDPAVLSAAAQAHLQAGDTQAADQLFARVAQLKPTDAKVRAALALSQAGRNGGDAALGELQSIAAEDKGTAVDMALISARLSRKDFDGALKAIAALQAKQPASPIPANLRGRVLLARRDLAAARQAFDEAVAKDGKYLPAVASLAALDLVEKKPEAARARFDALLKADPRNAQAMLALAEVKARTGATPQEVARQIAEAVSADPSDAAARLALIEHHLARRDYKQALAAAQAADAALPNQVELLDRLGRVQLALGDQQQALTAFNKIVSLRAESPLGPLGLAEVQLARKDFEAASRHAKRALELAPRSLPVIRTAITVALQAKQPQQALALTRTLQSQRPDDASGYLLEGEVEASQQHWDAAIAAFRKATTKPSPAQSPVRLHQALLQAGKSAEAAKFADAWLAGHPKDALFVYHLGDLALGQGDLALAEKRYQDVLKLQPEHALALNNIAWLMTRQKRPGAAALAERAVKAAPGEPALVDTLATALAAENQLPRALQLQKELVAQSPEVPVFRLNLAKLQLQAGDKAAARVELERLNKLGQDFAGRSELAPLLKSAGG